MSQAETIHKQNMTRYQTYLTSQIQPNVTGQFVGPSYFARRSKDAYTRQILPDHYFNTRQYPYGN